MLNFSIIQKQGTTEAEVPTLHCIKLNTKSYTIHFTSTKLSKNKTQSNKHPIIPQSHKLQIQYTTSYESIDHISV